MGLPSVVTSTTGSDSATSIHIIVSLSKYLLFHRYSFFQTCTFFLECGRLRQLEMTGMRHAARHYPPAAVLVLPG